MGNPILPWRAPDRQAGAADAFADTVAVQTLVPDSALQHEFPISGLDSQVPDSALMGADTGFPDIVTDLPEGSGAGTPLSQAPTLKHVGRYALKVLLGEGGLSQVHEAWDPLLSRTVAVKTLQIDLDAPTRVSLDGLFLGEARAVASLSHPYIVTVHDAGLSAHGLYIAMERLHGRDLRHALAQGWEPGPAQAALLVRRVADALAYAHARGVVHCDIKPGNIFLGRRDKPKVLDFGIACVTQGRMSEPAAGTTDDTRDLARQAQADAVMGSPHHLAPEQWTGGTVDGRTDVYALGTVLYELLTRRKAFGGRTLEEIRHAALHQRPPAAHEVDPTVPVTLSGIAARAMARDPRDRWPSAAAMSRALRAWLAGIEPPPAARGPTPAAPPAAPAAAPAPAPAAPAGRRPGAGWLAAAAMLAALGAGAGWLWASAGEARPPGTPNPGLRSAGGPVAGGPVTPGPTEATPTPPGPPGPTGPTGPTVALARTGVVPAAPTGPRAASPARPAAAAAAVPVAAGPAGNRAAAATPAPGRPAGSPPAARVAAPAAALPAARAEPAPVAAAAPAAAPGEVLLAISPWGDVEVNGQRVGTTPPLTRLILPPGRHQVTVRNTDLPPYSVTVDASPDAPVTVRHRF